MLSERTRARWTPDEDRTLVDVINRHVESGGSLTSAFAAAAELLQGRTPAACGFRWNTELKNNHVLAVQPKRGRRQRQDRPEDSAVLRASVSDAASGRGKAEAQPASLPASLPAALTQLLDAAPKVQLLFMDLTQEVKTLRDKLKQAERENKALRRQVAAFEQLADADAQRDLDMIVRLLQRAKQLNLTGQEQAVYERLDSPQVQSNIV